MRRGEYEFPQSVRDIALNEAGLENGDVHHRLPVWVAKQNGISPDLVRSPYNAVGLTEEEHYRAKHRGDFSQEIEELLELQPRLIEWEESA
jgi:hypothetical protein